MDSVKCRNCGNLGHKLKNCKFPRLSYGIVLFNEKNEIVMIEKCDSISYIEFIRGKYSIENTEYIQLLIDRMSIVEKDKLSRYSFKELWNDIWFSDNNSREYDKCHRKYEKISNGSKIKWVYLKNNNLGLDTVAYKGYEDPPEIMKFIPCTKPKNMN